jgi:hypothetical protein
VGNTSTGIPWVDKYCTTAGCRVINGVNVKAKRAIEMACETSDYRACEEPEVDVVEEPLEFFEVLDRVLFATGLAETGPDAGRTGVETSFALAVGFVGFAVVPTSMSRSLLPLATMDKCSPAVFPVTLLPFLGNLRLPKTFAACCGNLASSGCTSAKILCNSSCSRARCSLCWTRRVVVRAL